MIKTVFQVSLLFFFFLTNTAFAIEKTINISSNDAIQYYNTGQGGTLEHNGSTFSLAGTGSTLNWVGLRFENVYTLQGKPIPSASLSFMASSKKKKALTLRISGQAADSCTALDSEGSDLSPSNRPRTSAYVDWLITEDWEKDTRYSSPDIAPILNEIVSRDGWAPRNAICLFVERAPSDSGNKFRKVHALSDNSPDASVAATLSLEAVAYDTTYYLLENFPDAVCGPNPAFGGMTIAPTEESALWAGRCRDNYIPCESQIGCMENWDNIPERDVNFPIDGTFIKKIYDGVRYVNVPSCDMPCGETVQITQPNTDNTVTAYIWDACPHMHWNNQLNTVRYPNEPFHCESGNHHVDLFEDLYQALGGTFASNISVEIDEPTEPYTVCGDLVCGGAETAASCAQDCSQFLLSNVPIEDQLDGSNPNVTVLLPESLTGDYYIEIGLKNTSTGWQTSGWGTQTVTLLGTPNQSTSIEVNIAAPQGWMTPLAGSVGVFRWTVYVYPADQAGNIPSRIYTIEDSSYEFWYDYSDLVIETPDGCENTYCLIDPPIEGSLDGQDKVVTISLPESITGTRYIEVGLKNTSAGWTTNAWGTATVNFPGTPDATAGISVNIANPQSWMTPLAGSSGTYRWVIYVYPDSSSGVREFTLEDDTYEFSFDYSNL